MCHPFNYCGALGKSMVGRREIGVFYNAVLTKESLDNVFYTKNGFKKFEAEEYVQMGKEAGFSHISISPLGNKYGMLIEYKK